MIEQIGGVIPLFKDPDFKKLGFVFILYLLL
jgi:hypothetical protein